MRQKERQGVMQSRSAVLYEVSAKKEWLKPELNEVDYKETQAGWNAPENGEDLMTGYSS